jgi:phage terminase large subunit
MPEALNLEVQIPTPHLFLLDENPDISIKGLFGGRGGAKSHSAARALIARILKRPQRILCGREFQSSIRDSVHNLLETTIDVMKVGPRFRILKNAIECRNGGEIFYRGFSRNLQEIKSTEGLGLVWIEEAHFCTDLTFEVLLPTIRADDSELWLTWNTLDLEAPVHKRFVAMSRPDAIIRKVGWQDNPFFTRKLNKERLWMLRTDPIAYDHVWEGNERRETDATIFKGKYQVETFDTPKNARYYHGADWGFAEDPSVMIRCWMGPSIELLRLPEYFDSHSDETHLYIDMEAYGIGVEINHLPALFDCIPSSRKWPSFGDCSRPETISYMFNQGFPMRGADKWEGCVEDGIEHLKAFEKIYIHTRCQHMYEEARLYSFKVDPKDEKTILPIVVDKHNHCWDAVRYALNGIIQKRGQLALWAKLAKRRVITRR